MKTPPQNNLNSLFLMENKEHLVEKKAEMLGKAGIHK